MQDLLALVINATTVERFSSVTCVGADDWLGYFSQTSLRYVCFAGLGCIGDLLPTLNCTEPQPLGPGPAVTVYMPIFNAFSLLILYVVSRLVGAQMPSRIGLLLVVQASAVLGPVYANIPVNSYDPVDIIKALCIIVVERLVLYVGLQILASAMRQAQMPTTTRVIDDQN